jgi:uncharacterized protein YtpQ (UPF0354 family)
MRSAHVTLGHAMRPNLTGFAVVLLCLCCAGAARAQTEPPRDEAAFAKYVGDRIAASAGVKIETESPLSLRLLNGAGEYVMTAELDRIRAACERIRDKCAAFIAEYVAGVATMVADRTRPLDKASLRIALRPAAYLERVARERPAEAPISRPFPGELGLLLVVDGKLTLRMALRKDLESLKLSEAQAFDAARANLAKELKPLASVLKPVQGKAIGFLEESAYESSRLIFHGDWRAFAAGVEGSLIVTAPTTNVLLYGSGATPEAVDAMRTLARSVARRSERPLSPSILRWTAQGWEAVP